MAPRFFNLSSRPFWTSTASRIWADAARVRAAKRTQARNRVFMGRSVEFLELLARRVGGERQVFAVAHHRLLPFAAGDETQIFPDLGVQPPRLVHVAVGVNLI